MNISLVVKFNQIMVDEMQRIIAVTGDFPPTKETLQDFETASSELKRKVYEAASYFEYLDHVGLIYGNGHHVAQEIAAYAVERLKQRWKEKAIAHSPQN